MIARHLAKLFVLLALLPGAVLATVLPEDRADVLYHRYEGGGVTIDGPSVLLRKQVGKSFSLSANYYLDMVSSASIDVVTTASPYTEERKQGSLGVTYLYGNTLMNVGYTRSDESDYAANSLNFSVSQDLFGQMTTVTLGYALGWDEVGKSNDPDFRREVDRQQYSLAVTQIVTRSLIMSFAFDAITDEGFLNNPYRSVRYLAADQPAGYQFESEVYPNTRTSGAGSITARYRLPWRAALHGSYRYFSDTWGIESHTGEIGYVHPWKYGITFSTRYRHYTQDQADFYADLFPRSNAQNFMGRDKELSTFESATIRAGVSWEFVSDGWSVVEKGSLNLFWDRIRFDYENFRDLRVTGAAPGEEPLYGFDADVVQLFVSFWF